MLPGSHHRQPLSLNSDKTIQTVVFLQTFRQESMKNDGEVGALGADKEIEHAPTQYVQHGRSAIIS
jgi:hypothetical protein